MQKVYSIFIFLILCSFQVQAQQYVHQVIILNEVILTMLLTNQSFRQLLVVTIRKQGFMQL